MTTWTRSFKVLAFLAFAFLFLACSPQMYATTVLTLDDGVGDSLSVDQTGTITCAGACVFIASATGDHQTISAIGTLGQFSLNVTTGNGGGFETRPTLETLNSINATSTGAGTLTATFTDTNYTDLGPGFLLGVSGVENVSIDTSPVTFSAFASAANAVPATTLIGSIGPLSGLSFSSSNIFANPIGSSGSLTLKTVIAFTGQGTIQDNATISNVPEPTSVVLLGGALLFVAGATRRKATKKA
jgi:hypothetical protein